jgi:hypothetical protein
MKPLAGQDVLRDLIERLKRQSMEAARQGVKEATSLALEADRLIKPLLNLPDADCLSGLESVAKGLEYGLAKIAESNAKNYFKGLINTALGFASTLLGGVKF